MAGEFKSTEPVDYYVMLNVNGQAWNGMAFEDVEAGNWADYEIESLKVTGVKLWLGNMPSGVPAGIYDVIGYQKVGGDPDPDDLEVGTDQIDTRDVTISGTVSASSTTTGFAAAAGLSAINDFYNNSYIAFTSGNLKGLSRLVTDYVGSTRTFTFPALPQAPSSGDEFVILGRAEP